MLVQLWARVDLVRTAEWSQQGFYSALSIEMKNLSIMKH